MTAHLPPAAAATAPPDDNQLIAERREKLSAIRAAGVAFPNDFKPRHHAAELHQRHGEVANEVLEPQAVQVARSRLSSAGTRYSAFAPQTRQCLMRRGMNMRRSVAAGPA